VANGMPAGQKLEVEFTAGVWTDVSQYVDLATSGVTITRSRSSQFSQPPPATLNCNLINSDGRFTPNRQVLADGVTAHPYWPNVVPRKRVRVSYTISATTYYRFLGYIKSWTPAREGGVLGLCQVQASDRDDRLSRVMLQPPIPTEYTQDSPSVVWSLTDVAGSTTAIDYLGKFAPLTVTHIGASGAITFGDVGPGSGDGTGVKLAPASASSGYYLSTSTKFLPTVTPSLVWAYTIEAFIQVPVAPTGGNTFSILAFDDVNGAMTDAVLVNSSGVVEFVIGSIPAGTAPSGNVCDGGWHHVAATYSSNGSNPTIQMFVDGVSTGAAVSMGAPDQSAAQNLLIGQASRGFVSSLFAGNIGWVAYYPAALSSTRIAAHSAAGHDYIGDTTGTRIPRYLTAAGLTSADWTLATGVALVNSYPQQGKSVLQACQDMADTEGGGAAFFVDPTGTVRFVDRAYRKPLTPVVTVDSVNDLVNSPFQPTIDETVLVNQISVDRSTESGSQSTQVYTKAGVAQSDVYSNNITTYTMTDADALALAQYQVATLGTPAYRLPQVAVELSTSVTAGLAVSLASVLPGSRFRVTNLPADVAPSTQMDFFVEGWTEQIDIDTYTWTLDLSPADAPPRGQWGVTLWQCDGQTLTSNITAAATSLSITTAAGKATFSTTAGSYPVTIQIGEESMTLNTHPSGSTSPQSFTGVTRGVNGSPAAAQTSGSVVSLDPASGWTM
jgi:hypothetical protein